MASSPQTRVPRSLADDLRARSAAQVSRLLQLRPDLMHPWPADLSQLARRAADDASVLDAMQSLNTTALRVLEAFACLHEASAEQVSAGLGEQPETVSATIDELWLMALLWGSAGSYRIVRAAQQAFGPFPCALAPAGSGPASGDQIRAARQLPEDVLTRLVWQDPLHDSAHPALVMRSDRYLLAREVSLELREGVFLPPVGGPPALPAAHASAGSLLWVPIAGVRYLLSTLRRERLSWHSERGVSRRAVSDFADTMAVPVEDLLVWLELAAAAGLIGGQQDHVCPTSHASDWLEAGPQQMWSILMRAWLHSERPLGSCRSDELGVLTTAGRPRTAHHRAHVLRVWPAQSVVDVDALTRTVAWQRPRMHRAAEMAPEVYAEATRLGLVEAGVATEALSLLPDKLSEAAATVPGSAAQDSLFVQPDHTMIAPVNIDTQTWNLIDSISHVESWGPVTMHRIDPTRLRSAVAGTDPQHIVDQLARASKTGVPQSVEYAVRDAARVAAARAYRATVVHAGPHDEQRLRDLGFEQITTQVFVTDLPVDVAQQRLTSAGIPVSTPQPRDVAEPIDYPRADQPPDAHAITRLVTHLLGDQARTDLHPPELVPADPAMIVEVCRRAVADDRRLWVRYTDGADVRTEYVEPIEVRSGRLTAWSLSTGRTLGVPIARIAAYGADQ
jgi:hypothetical protein